MIHRYSAIFLISLFLTMTVTMTIICLLPFVKGYKLNECLYGEKCDKDYWVKIFDGLGPSYSFDISNQIGDIYLGASLMIDGLVFLRIDNFSNIVWANLLNSKNCFSILDITHTDNGIYVVLGCRNSVIIAKMLKNCGDVVWAKNISITLYGSGKVIKINNYIYLFLTLDNNTKLLIIKIDTNGNILAKKTYNLYHRLVLHSVTTDSKHIYVYIERRVLPGISTIMRLNLDGDILNFVGISPSLKVTGEAYSYDSEESMAIYGNAIYIAGRAIATKSNVMEANRLYLYKVIIDRDKVDLVEIILNTTYNMSQKEGDKHIIYRVNLLADNSGIYILLQYNDGIPKTGLIKLSHDFKLIYALSLNIGGKCYINSNIFNDYMYLTFDLNCSSLLVAKVLRDIFPQGESSIYVLPTGKNIGTIDINIMPLDVDIRTEIMAHSYPIHISETSASILISDTSLDLHDFYMPPPETFTITTTMMLTETYTEPTTITRTTTKTIPSTTTRTTTHRETITMKTTRTTTATTTEIITYTTTIKTPITSYITTTATTEKTINITTTDIVTTTIPTISVPTLISIMVIATIVGLETGFIIFRRPET